MNASGETLDAVSSVWTVIGHFVVPPLRFGPDTPTISFLARLSLGLMIFGFAWDALPRAGMVYGRVAAVALGLWLPASGTMGWVESYWNFMSVILAAIIRFGDGLWLGIAIKRMRLLKYGAYSVAPVAGFVFQAVTLVLVVRGVRQSLPTYSEVAKTSIAVAAFLGALLEPAILGGWYAVLYVLVLPAGVLVSLSRL